MLQPIDYKTAPKEVFNTFKYMYKQSFKPTLIAQIIHGAFLGFFITIIIAGFVIAGMFNAGYFYIGAYQNYCFLFLLICIFCCLLDNSLKNFLNLRNPLQHYNITMFKSEYGVSRVLAELKENTVIVFKPPVYISGIVMIDAFFSSEYDKERDVFVLEYKNPKDETVRLYHVVDPQLMKPIVIYGTMR